jgi:hypothetical protein
VHIDNDAKTRNQSKAINELTKTDDPMPESRKRPIRKYNTMKATIKVFYRPTRNTWSFIQAYCILPYRKLVNYQKAKC